MNIIRLLLSVGSKYNMNIISVIYCYTEHISPLNLVLPLISVITEFYLKQKKNNDSSQDKTCWWPINWV